MAESSKIEWTDATWNIVTGCSVVSPACTNCYAMRLAGTRLRHHPSRAGLTQASKAGPVWTGAVRFNAEWLLQPLRWARPRKIFVAAHGDLFHESVLSEWLDHIFAVMALAPQHVFQVLTKRPARMREYLTSPATAERITRVIMHMHMQGIAPQSKAVRIPLPNVWLGVTVEDQPRADERLEDLRRTPAAVRFISFEPLLGPIFAENWFSTGAFHWVICGGESGPMARPTLKAWRRSLRDQCAAAGVAFFHKQNGEWIDADEWLDHLYRSGFIAERGGLIFDPQRPLNFEDARCIARLTQELYEHQSDGSTMIRVGKARAGRLLDGVEWSQFPGAAG